MYETVVVPMMFVSAADSMAFFGQVYEEGLAAVPSAMAHRPTASFVFLKDVEGAIMGGGFVQFTFDVAAIDILWVARSLRGNGYGAVLYRSIESLAIKKGMSRAVVSTFEFQGAISFWNKMGFTSFAKIDDYPEGSKLVYLQKRFSSAAVPKPGRQVDSQ